MTKKFTADFAHAAEVLELNEVLKLVAGYCRNESTRKKAECERPGSKREEIERSLARIESMRDFLIEEGDFPIGDTSCAKAVEDAKRLERTIESRELLSLASLEKTVFELKKRIKKRKKGDEVEQMVGDLSLHKPLFLEIERAIEEDGSISSDSSARLSGLRKKIATLKDDLRSRADRLASKYGGDAYATVIEGRFILLVPAVLFRKGDGLVYSKSHSGGSVYFEPAELLERNNGLANLLREEREEENRILKKLSRMVMEAADEISENIEIMENLDLLRAKALFCSHWRCSSPVFSSNLRLVKARHPLLEKSLKDAGREKELVPLNVEIKPEANVLVITGPNAGGKTVALRTVGLCVLMFHMGMQVPSESGAEMPVFKAVYADIGDEQSITSSLSTFTSHLRHLDEMCRNASNEVLCLVDEIGGGTDPDEGSALACAALERLGDRGATVIATTHYDRVKAYVTKQERMRNACMLFDDAGEKPLFILLQGFPGRSMGLETAQRFGFDEGVLARSRELLGEEALKLDRLLAQLEGEIREFEAKKREFERQSRELEKVISVYMEREKTLKDMQATHAEKTRAEAEELLRNARREIEQIVKEIRESKAEREVVKAGHERLKSMLNAARDRSSHRMREKGTARELSIGDLVSLNRDASSSGEIKEIQNGMATVEIAGKRIKISIERLFKVQPKPEEESERTGYRIDFEPLGSTSIDVRGQRREDALEAVDKFLDRATLSGVHQVIIVHGVGEGILLGAIRDKLRGDPRVKSFRSGMDAEGGSGVSIVELA